MARDRVKKHHWLTLGKISRRLQLKGGKRVVRATCRRDDCVVARFVFYIFLRTFFVVYVIEHSNAFHSVSRQTVKFFQPWTQRVDVEWTICGNGCGLSEAWKRRKIIRTSRKIQVEYIMLRVWLILVRVQILLYSTYRKQDWKTI